MLGPAMHRRKDTIFKLLIVETVFLAVNKGSFKRASLCYFPFVLIGCYFCFSEVISLYKNDVLEQEIPGDLKFCGRITLNDFLF